METWDAITSRRDVREYTDESLGSQGVGRDSGGGSARAVVSELQPWDCVVVADREQLGRLSGVWQGAGHVARSAATVALVVRNGSSSPRSVRSTTSGRRACR